MNPMLMAARTYLDQHMPELKSAPLHLHALDGPPESPHYAVTAETCFGGNCPYGISAAVAAAGQCSVLDCPLRRSVRLLLDRRGIVLHATRGGIHWG